jgi:hypothetical protein
MSISPRPVEQAASFLKSSSATPKEKLLIGGKLLWAATMVPEGWTPELLDRARTAYKFLLKCDSMQRTVEQDGREGRQPMSHTIHQGCNAIGD